MNYDIYEHLFKVVLAGDACVGKTTFMGRFVEGIFDGNFIGTIGVDFRSKIIDVKVNNKPTKVKLQIWDTAGNQKFREIIRSYYRSAHIIVIMFDLTCMESFINVENWLNEINEINSTCHKMLVGTKSDLVSQRVVTDDKIHLLATKLNLHYVETSSKNGTNIGHSLTTTIEKLLEMPDRIIPPSAIRKTEIKFALREQQKCCVML